MSTAMASQIIERRARQQRVSPDISEVLNMLSALEDKLVPKVEQRADKR